MRIFMARKNFEKEFIRFFDDEFCEDIQIDEIYSNLQESSLDDSNNIYLVNSNKNCINFDECKNLYIKKHNLWIESNYPNEKISYLDQYKSNDVIINIGGMDYFIEFKNTSNMKFIKLFEKIKDSIIIYLDVLDENFSYIKNNLGYIYVYSYDKNDDRMAPEYEHLDFLTKNIKKHAKEPLDKYNLKKKLEGFYFKKVLVMNNLEFEEKINKLIIEGC